MFSWDEYKGTTRATTDAPEIPGTPSLRFVIYALIIGITVCALIELWFSRTLNYYMARYFGL